MAPPYLYSSPEGTIKFEGGYSGVELRQCQQILYTTLPLKDNQPFFLSHSKVLCCAFKGGGDGGGRLLRRHQAPLQRRRHHHHHLYCPGGVTTCNGGDNNGRRRRRRRPGCLQCPVTPTGRQHLPLPTSAASQCLLETKPVYQNHLNTNIMIHFHF